MKQCQVLQTEFADVITANFEFTDYKKVSLRWSIGSMNVNICLVRTTKRKASVLMALLKQKQYRIAPSVDVVFSCTFAVESGLTDPQAKSSLIPTTI
jgi:hypothetical protein